MTLQPSIIANHESFLKPIALKFTKNETLSQDLIQDTLLKALENTHRFKESTNLKAWLYTIMRNIFINSYRKNQRFRRVDTPLEDLHQLIFSSVSVDNHAERNLTTEVLNGFLNDIPDKHKKPFIMFFEGFKYEEIAQSLSLPLGTVKSRIFNVRKMLQTKLDKLELV